MPTYPAYKLGEVAEVILGQSPDSKSYNTSHDGLPFFQGKSEFTEWHPIPNKWCTEPKKIAEPLDILLSVRAPVGPTNVAKERCCIGRGLAAIRYPDCYKYVLYYLRSVSKFLESKATGTTFAAISGDVIKNLPIPLPPLATQRAIVTRIESLFAELDKGVEKLKTAQQQLKVYRQAVLNDCLTKGREKWKKVKLKDICLSISDGDHLPPKRTDKGVPFITISDIKGNSIDFSNVSYMTEEYYENLSQSRKATVGDILYTVTGSYGIPVLVENNIKFCFQRHIGLIRPNSTIVMQRWLYYMMQSPIIYSQATEKSTGTAQKTVTLSVLRDFELCLPPLPIQQRIVQEIETRLSACDEVEKNINESLQQAEVLRQSILKKAFSGELV